MINSKPYQRPIPKQLRVHFIRSRVHKAHSMQPETCSTNSYTKWGYASNIYLIYNKIRRIPVSPLVQSQSLCEFLWAYCMRANLQHSVVSTSTANTLGGFLRAHCISTNFQHLIISTGTTNMFKILKVYSCGLTAQLRIFNTQSSLQTWLMCLKFL